MTQKIKKTVLIAEDIEENRELLKDLLKSSYNIIEACDGEKALEYLKINGKNVSCLILDLIMPKLDGFQLLEILKKDKILNEIPVVITSEQSPNSELRAIHLGAQGFVGKPYNTEILLHHIKLAVNEHELNLLKKTNK